MNIHVHSKPKTQVHMSGAICKETYLCKNYYISMYVCFTMLLNSILLHFKFPSFYHGMFIFTAILTTYSVIYVRS